MTAVLRLPNYRRLLAAYALNELAGSIGALALALLVYGQTGSALAAAAFFVVLQFLPALVSPALVARLDRHAARRVLAVLYGLQGLVFLVLAAVQSRFSLAPVLALVFVGGSVALVARVIARATAVGVIAPAGLLREGNAVTNAAFAVCITVGPIVGAAIVAGAGTSVALLVDCGMFVAIGLTVATAAGLPGARPEPEREQAAGRVRAAVARAHRDVVIRRLLIFQAVALVFFSLSVPVEVVFAQHSLHAGAGGYGGLLSAWGSGAIAGSVAYARWRAVPGWVLIALSSGLIGLGFLLMAAAPSLVVAIIGSAVGGVGNGIEAVAERTALQERVHERWMALMMSLNESIFQALPGVGIVLGGAVAAVAGPRAALAVGGVGALAVGAAAPVVLRVERPLAIPADAGSDDVAEALAT